MVAFSDDVYGFNLIMASLTLLFNLRNIGDGGGGGGGGRDASVSSKLKYLLQCDGRYLTMR